MHTHQATDPSHHLKLATGALLLAVSVASSSCFLMRARENIARLDQASRIAGKIDVLGSSATPVVINLVRRTGEASWQPEQQWLRYGSGPFECLAGTGDFVLLAWEDSNQDLVFQSTENVGWYGGEQPTPITTTPGQNLKSLAIQMRSPSSAMGSLPALYQDTRIHQPFELPNNHNGEIIALDDPRLDKAVGNLGMWEPVKFLEEGYHGIFFLEPYAEDKIPVLFVHGINGSGSDWLSLLEHVDRQRFQPWILQYPSGMRLGMLADHIRQSLLKLRLQHGFPHLFVVAHSMGGLVSRGLLNRCVENGDDWVRLFVTFSSPFGGHDSARSGVAYSPAVVPSWYDMVPESDYLATLFDHPLPATLPHHLAFGFKGATGWLGGDSNDGVVTIKSQLRAEAQASAASVTGFDASHVGILNCKQGAAYLRERLDKAAQRVAR